MSVTRIKWYITPENVHVAEGSPLYYILRHIQKELQKNKNVIEISGDIPFIMEQLYPFIIKEYNNGTEEKYDMKICGVDFIATPSLDNTFPPKMILIRKKGMWKCNL